MAPGLLGINLPASAGLALGNFLRSTSVWGEALVLGPTRKLFLLVPGGEEGGSCRGTRVCEDVIRMSTRNSLRADLSEPGKEYMYLYRAFQIVIALGVQTI